MGEPLRVARIGDGVYRVETGGRADLVYVAGTSGDRWAFCNGRVFRLRANPPERAGAPRRRPSETPQAISAPMPATVLKVLATPGGTVKKGETLVILEAMKMELPLRAEADGTVVSVHCREGELVQPDTILVELT